SPPATRPRIRTSRKQGRRPAATRALSSEIRRRVADENKLMKLAPLILLPALLAPVFLSQPNLPVRFDNVAAKVGVTFKHENGASTDKHLPEIMSGGAVIFDYNNDGWPDLFLVNGGSFVNKQVAAAARHRLYRNTGDGKFEDVTESSGIGISGFGMGA